MAEVNEDSDLVVGNHSNIPKQDLMSGRWGQCKPWVGIILLGILSGLLAPLYGRGESLAPKQVRILTYNVFFQNTNWMSVVEILNSSNADVVALQETTPESEVVLRKELASSYPHIEFRHAPSSGGLALLTRLETRNSEYIVVTNRSARGIMLAEFKSRDGRWMKVANIHLPTPRVGQMKTVGSALEVFQRAGAAQEREIQRLWNFLQVTNSAREAVIICGDFNSFSFGPAQAFLKEKGFKDSFAEVTPDADTHPTWFWRERGGAHRYRIDYIFHSGALKTVSSRIETRGSSDHFPVESVVE